MQIVIDIPEKLLSSKIIDVTLFTGVNNTITDVNVEDKYAEFQILTEGHGDLIDRDTLINLCENYTKENAIGLILAGREDYLPTVIKADKNEVD